MKQYKILFLTGAFSYGGGATAALISFIERMPFISPDSKIYVKKVLAYCRNEKINSMIVSENGKNALLEFINGNYDFIHWFKSADYKIFSELLSARKKVSRNVPILTYVLQNPTYRYGLLTPKELKYSKHIVFIDKASYNNTLLSFIPDTCKSMIYCNFRTEQDIWNMDELGRTLNVKKDSNKIVFGRGSTLNKCPKDMFEKVFDRINCDNKKFVIVGHGIRYWIEDKIKDREGKYDVDLFDSLSYEKWIEKLLSFDIFLYYLPEDAYSSLDGTLGQAMFYGIPVVYYGPDAPKERFTHGYDGFVADTKDDIVKYCNMLASDPELRQKIGENGRKTNIEKFNINITLGDFENVYNAMIDNNVNNQTKVPLSYLCYFYRYQIMNPFVRSTEVLRKVIGLITHGKFLELMNRIKKGY